MRNFDYLENDNTSSQSSSQQAYASSDFDSWYVSKFDAFSGPYSTQDLIHQIRKNQITETDLVWTRTKKNWIAINSVPVFKVVFDNQKKAKEAQEILKTKKNIEKITADKTHLPNRQLSDWKGSDEFWNYIKNSESVLKTDASLSDDEFIQKMRIEFEKNPIDPKVIIAPNNFERRRLNVRRSFVFGMIISIAIATVTLKNRFKTIDDIPGLNYSQNLEAKSIMSEPLSAKGPRAGIYLASSVEKPQFLLASNLKDGADVLLKIQGIPDTLVGAFVADYQIQVKFKNGQVLSPFMVKENSNSLPVGEYKLTLSCIDCLDEHLERNYVLAEKTMFLGADKDDSYDLKLVKYHGELRQQAREELKEYEQIVQTIQKQHAIFESEYKQKIEMMKSQDRWLTAFSNWLQIQTQLKLEVERLLTKNARNEIYYSDLLNQVNQSLMLLTNLEKQKNKEYQIYLNKTSDFSQRIQDHKSISHEISEYTKALLIKISDLETLPLTANGMPRKTKH